jgi:hypothetical protein
MGALTVDNIASLKYATQAFQKSAASAASPTADETSASAQLDSVDISDEAKWFAEAMNLNDGGMNSAPGSASSPLSQAISQAQQAVRGVGLLSDYTA